MALKTVKTTNNFTPDMIGDVVEIMTYDKTDGETALFVGTLVSYGVREGVIGVIFETSGATSNTAQISTDTYTVTITQYEWEHDFIKVDEADEEDDE